jgi:hypothetical protein
MMQIEKRLFDVHKQLVKNLCQDATFNIVPQVWEAVTVSLFLD